MRRPWTVRLRTGPREGRRGPIDTGRSGWGSLARVGRGRWPGSLVSFQRLFHPTDTAARDRTSGQGKGRAPRGPHRMPPDRKGEAPAAPCSVRPPGGARGRARGVQPHGRLRIGMRRPWTVRLRAGPRQGRRGPIAAGQSGWGSLARTGRGTVARVLVPDRRRRGRSARGSALVTARAGAPCPRDRCRRPPPASSSHRGGRARRVPG